MFSFRQCCFSCMPAAAGAWSDPPAPFICRTRGARLTFPDAEAEREFALHLTLQTLGVSWKLNVVMAMVWMLRLLITSSRCMPQAALGCTMVSLMCASMSSIHQCCAVMSWYRVGWGTRERGKSAFLLSDLTACMVLVILTRGRVNFPIVFQPALVFTLHGWAILFAGCRLIADIYLHILNLMVLILLSAEQAMHHNFDISWLSLTVLLLMASIFPLLANIRFEARCRKAFLARRARSDMLGDFWSSAS